LSVERRLGLSDGSGVSGHFSLKWTGLWPKMAAHRARCHSTLSFNTQLPRASRRPHRAGDSAPTGNIGRLCLATGAPFALVKPLGFSIERPGGETRRARLWKDVRVRSGNLSPTSRPAQPADARYFFLTTKTERAYWMRGFATAIVWSLAARPRGCRSLLLERNAGGCLTIPMSGGTRSLNLATAVGIVLYEAVRQGKVDGLMMDG